MRLIKKLLLAIFFLGTSEFLFGCTIFTSSSVDAVFAGNNEDMCTTNTLHHLTNKELEISITRQSEIMNTKGIICHSFWAGEGSETYNGLFVNYHTMKELKRLFATCFEIQIMERYKEFETNDSIFLIGVKK